MTKSEVKVTKEVANFQTDFQRAIIRIKFFRILKETILVAIIQHPLHNINLCCIMQFEAKTYKSQRKGFTEVTGNFHYKFAD